MCFKSNSRVLVVVKCFYFFFHFVPCYECWCGQHWSFESITNLCDMIKKCRNLRKGWWCKLWRYYAILHLFNGVQSFWDPQHVGNHASPLLQKHEMYSGIRRQFNCWYNVKNLCHLLLQMYNHWNHAKEQTKLITTFKNDFFGGQVVLVDDILISTLKKKLKLFWWLPIWSTNMITP